METTWKCRVCGGQKVMHIANEDNQDLIVQHDYELSPDDFLLGVSCSGCGLMYTQESVGK